MVSTENLIWQSNPRKDLFIPKVYYVVVVNQPGKDDANASEMMLNAQSTVCVSDVLLNIKSQTFKTIRTLSGLLK